MTTHDQRGISELPTAPLPVAGSLAEKPRVARQSRLAACAGVGTAVLVIMALGMIGAQVYSAAHHDPGPGVLAVGAHVVAAIFSVPLYRLARKDSGRVRWLAGGALLVLMLLVLWIFWWAA